MYSKKEVRSNASIDAKNNLPGKDDPNFSQFEQEVMAMAKNEARQVKAKYEPGLKTLTGKYKPLLKEYGRISADYEKHSAAIKRSEPSVELSRGKYYFLMILFVVGEVPMNSLAFAVFGESQIFTWIMALGVAVAIPWIAHALGILLKRGSDPWWKSGIGVGVLLLLTVAGLLAIGFVRVEYLEDLNASGAGSDGGFGSSNLAGAAFIGLNLVILAAATLCSYFAHDKDPMLEHLHRKTSKIGKQMREVEAKHNKILTIQDQDIKRIHQRAQEIIYYYRKINQRERPDHAKPKSFEREHKLVIEIDEDDDSQKVLNATGQFRKQAAAKTMSA